ncbi:MAG TPA: hypothetical protein VLT33_45785 [Labilithrix sp.]|nr:hypothetical protein [Labilithrix sp.]
MRIRAVHLLVPVLVLAVSGCGLLKKKKKSFDDSPTPTPLSDLEPPAINRADLARFPDEVLLHGQSDLIRQITFARTAPNEGGTTVGVIDADTGVLKWSLRNGNTLISFDRAAFPGKRFAGWVPDSAFRPAVAAGKVPTVPTGVKPVTTSTSTATATATATATVAGINAPPPTGQCTLTLRSTSFIPSTSTCSFEEKVRAGSPATLSFPCAGGAATARFSSQTFSGTADPKKVQISNTTVFPFSGCQVRAIQTISGTPPNLSYFYSESIVSGKCPGTSTCTARGSVSAQ